MAVEAVNLHIRKSGGLINEVGRPAAGTILHDLPQAVAFYHAEDPLDEDKQKEPVATNGFLEKSFQLGGIQSSYSAEVKDSMPTGRGWITFNGDGANLTATYIDYEPVNVAVLFIDEEAGRQHYDRIARGEPSVPPKMTQFVDVDTSGARIDFGSRQPLVHGSFLINEEVVCLEADAETARFQINKQQEQLHAGEIISLSPGTFVEIPGNIYGLAEKLQGLLGVSRTQEDNNSSMQQEEENPVTIDDLTSIPFSYPVSASLIPHSEVFKFTE